MSRDAYGAEVRARRILVAGCGAIGSTLPGDGVQLPGTAQERDVVAGLAQLTRLVTGLEKRGRS